MRWLLKRSATSLLLLIWASLIALSIVERFSPFFGLRLLALIGTLVTVFGYPVLLLFWLPTRYASWIMRQAAIITSVAAAIGFTAQLAMEGQTPPPWAPIVVVPISAVAVVGLLLVVPWAAARALVKAERANGVPNGGTVFGAWLAFFYTIVGGLGWVHRRVQNLSPYLRS